MSKKKTATEETQEPSFETAMADLESVVRELEAGNVPLEQGLQLFERGVVLLDRCKKSLEDAEVRIRELVAVDDDGQFQLKPFDHRATAGK